MARHCGSDDCSCGEKCNCRTIRQGKVWAALLLVLGLMLTGAVPGCLYYKAKMGSNFVNVKGLAEMDVKADLAVWTLKYVVTNNDLQQAKATMDQNQQTILKFLAGKGFDAENISLGRMETNDLMANPYGGDMSNKPRYILSQSITISSQDVELVAKSSSEVGDLVSQGVIFDNQNYQNPVSYIFTKLNEIKPQMLEEATKNAYEAAEQFAKSSNSSVGKIHRASQGVFSIQPRNQTQDYQSEMQFIDKKVRVVSTIEYYLK